MRKSNCNDFVIINEVCMFFDKWRASDRKIWENVRQRDALTGAKGKEPKPILKVIIRPGLRNENENEKEFGNERNRAKMARSAQFWTIEMTQNAEKRSIRPKLFIWFLIFRVNCAIMKLRKRFRLPAKPKSKSSSGGGRPKCHPWKIWHGSAESR